MRKQHLGMHPIQKPRATQIEDKKKTLGLSPWKELPVYEKGKPKTRHKSRGRSTHCISCFQVALHAYAVSCSASNPIMAKGYREKTCQ